MGPMTVIVWQYEMQSKGESKGKGKGVSVLRCL